MIIHELSHYIYGIIYHVTIIGISLFSYYGVIGLYIINNNYIVLYHLNYQNIINKYVVEEL